ncbi:MAG: class I SAM-dependent methyltransferase [Candidatus Velthaea sp.]
MTTTAQRAAPAAPNPEKLQAFAGKAIGEIAAAVSAVLVVIGDRLGLYRALADSGPLTSRQLAERTGTAERYTREWLANQAAGGFVEYDAAAGTFFLPPEQAYMLADPTSPLNVQGAFAIVEAVFADGPKIADAFRTGRGFAWHEHDGRLFEAVERFFRPSYNAHLVSTWIPALNDVDAKLRSGGRVADVGCGHGASTILIAQAYPRSTIVGFDYHEPSIAWARKSAASAGCERLSFEVGRAQQYPGTGYDLVTFFDCLHDMGDPVSAARHVLGSLAPDGTWMLVEPFANDRLEDNLNPVGRAYYGFSTLICTPASKAQEVGLALGAQAGEAQIHNVVTEAGFTRFRRVAETPFNIVYEVRP